MVVLPKLDLAPKVYREFVAEGKSEGNPKAMKALDLIIEQF